MAFSYADYSNFKKETKAEKKLRKQLNTPQTKPLKGFKKNMIKNEEGGYVFKLDKWNLLTRFLILGTEGGSYYMSESDLTKMNVRSLDACLQEDPLKFIEAVEKVLYNGRAPKVGPCFFALAKACAYKIDDPMDQKGIEVRKAALNAVSQGARTSYHLFLWMTYAKKMRGMGRAFRRTIQQWYNDRPLRSVAYQALKYKQREGWSHRDLFNLGHPKATISEYNGQAREVIYNYIAKDRDSYLVTRHIYDPLETNNKILYSNSGISDDERAIAQIMAAESLAKTESISAAVDLITTYNLPRECVPTQFQKNPEIWEALLPGMGMDAVLRNVNRMTACGLLTERSEAMKVLIDKLQDETYLKNAKTHPIKAFIAFHQYKQGKGDKGSLTWTPVHKVLSLLDDTFYSLFKYTEPSNKTILVGIDCSGSMSYETVMGLDIKAAYFAAAMACSLINIEPHCLLMRFETSGKFLHNIKPGMRIDDVLKALGDIGGGTDISLPFKYANKFVPNVEAIVSFTDNVTWAGATHAFSELTRLRQNQDCMIKAINCAVVPNRYGTLPESMEGTLEIAGADGSLPSIISEFLTNKDLV